jgi:hypothetical protein
VPDHYAYCRRADCPGCLPTDEQLAGEPLIGLWAEMHRRCIAQTPQTKTLAGAYLALLNDGDRYRRYSRDIRTRRTANGELETTAAVSGG